MPSSKAYPKDGDDEPGRDLFDAFRPCIIRAYNDAKDIMPDSGEQVRCNYAEEPAPSKGSMLIALCRPAIFL